MPHGKYPFLSNPIKIRNKVFRNRIVATPASLFWADFQILDRDIFNCPREEIS